jgi:hypothetical protein
MDNLYKFAALSGVALVGFLIWLTWRVQREIQAGLLELSVNKALTAPVPSYRYGSLIAGSMPAPAHASFVNKPRTKMDGRLLSRVKWNKDLMPRSSTNSSIVLATLPP